jgi:hypothetical protein
MYLIDDANEQRAIYTKVMAQVSTLVSPEVLTEIKDIIGESGVTERFAVVSAPVGSPQDDNFSLGPVYIDQYCNGGFTGDDYAGSICLPLGAGMYLQFHYVM